MHRYNHKHRCPLNQGPKSTINRALYLGPPVGVFWWGITKSSDGVPFLETSKWLKNDSLHRGSIPLEKTI